MAERGHVLESAEDARRDPAGKGKEPARFLRCCVVSKEGMEAQNAAISHAARVVQREEEGIGEERDVQGIGGEPSGVDFIHHEVKNLLVEELVQQKDHGV